MPWCAHSQFPQNHLARDEEISGSPHPGGYAGVRYGEVRNAGPAEYERDHTLEPHARRTRIDAVGDAVPGSQDHITRGAETLQLADIPTAQSHPSNRSSTCDAQFPKTTTAASTTTKTIPAVRPALDLWDLIVAVLHGNTYQSNQERGDPYTNLVRVHPHKLPT